MRSDVSGYRRTLDDAGFAVPECNDTLVGCGCRAARAAPGTGWLVVLALALAAKRARLQRAACA